MQQGDHAISRENDERPGLSTREIPDRPRFTPPARGALALLAVACLAGTQSGCTFLGLALGAASTSKPGRATVIPGYSRVEVPRGSEVIVRKKNGENIEGRYEGPLERANGEIDSRHIVIKTDHGQNPVALSSIGSITYEESADYGPLLGGLLVGVTIDALFVIAVTSAVRDMDMGWKSDDS